MKKTTVRFGSKALSEALKKLPTPRKYWVGFSGGADSTALLLALHNVQGLIPFQAIHFHHGLNEEADAWLDHCEDFCATREIPFTSQSLNLPEICNSNIEESARDCRYQAISELLGSDEMYLTAHHADDVAETLFINLMRGSGLEGLASIPELRQLAAGWVARPLLDRRRTELEDYLSRNRVKWLEDPSNKDQSYDRNYLRNQLFPTLKHRWPGLITRLNRSARIARSTSEVLADFITRQFSELLDDPHRMPLDSLRELESPMQALVLRQWLRMRGVTALPESRMLEFLDQLRKADSNSRAEVRWKQWQLKLYKPYIWLQDTSIPDRCGRHPWTAGMKMELDQRHGYLELQGEIKSIPKGWQIDSRQEGNRIQLTAGGSRSKLKELFRQSGIPPWLRPAIPVLYWQGEAVAVGDWIIADKMNNWLSTHKLEYRWYPADPLLSELQSACHHLPVDR